MNIAFAFIDSFNAVQQDTFDTAISKGWDEKGRSQGESIALIHSELSEALESIRNNNPVSSKIPDFSETEEEFADVVIRIMNFGKAHGLNIAGAILAKAEFNKSRPHRHGGKAF